MLGVEIFEDGLDHHVGMCRPEALGIGNQAIERIAQTQRVTQPLGERCLCPGNGRRDVRNGAVLQGHAQAAQGTPGGDITAHHASTDDMNMTNDERFAGFAEGFEALLQMEHPHQIERRRRTNDGVDRFRRGERVAGVLFPQIDDRIRCRVVLRPRLGGQLLARAARHDRLERSGEQARHQRQGPARRHGEHELPRRGVHHAWRYASIGEPEPFGTHGIDRLAGEHQVERRRSPDPLRETQHAPPAREDAEHHLRQPQLGRRLVHHQQVAAGQGQL